MKEYFLWLAKLITLVFVIIFGVALLISTIFAASTQHIAQNLDLEDVTPRVAVVKLHGIIQDSTDVLKELYKYATNDNIDAIVLDINSPGGAVGPSQAVFSAVEKLKKIKPIVAKMDTVAASGGLYASLSASKIYCQPGTLTGSIGVIMQLPNFTNIAKTVGFEMMTIKSGDLKDAGNAFRPMTEKDQEYFQNTIDVAYEAFFNDVVKSRNLDPESFRKYADGRVILGSQAVEFGLVDGYGDVYDAAREALKLAEVELKEGEFPTLVYKENKLEELRELLSSWMSMPEILGSHMKLMYLMQ